MLDEQLLELEDEEDEDAAAEEDGHGTDDEIEYVEDYELEEEEEDMEDLEFNGFMEDDRHNFYGEDSDGDDPEDGGPDAADGGAARGAAKRPRNGGARAFKGKRRNVEVEYEEGGAQRAREREALTQRETIS